MLHYVVEDAFAELLSCWREHHRRQGLPTATVAQLGESRTALDRARSRMHRLRIALHPSDDDLDIVVQRIWCESLESVVHLSWSMRHPHRPGQFECPCGERVDVDWDRIGDLPAP